MSGTEIAAAAVAVVLASGALARRQTLGRGRMLGMLAASVGLAVYATGVLAGLPSAETVIEDLGSALGRWTYVLVGTMAFLETGAFVGLVAPGETTVLLGGVVAGQGEISLLPLIGLVWVCGVLGDSTSFFIGRRLGRDFLLRHGPRFKITHERLEQVEGYFQRHGGKTILIGRFIGLVRALAPFVAGSSRMRYSAFLPYSVIGTGLWGATFAVLGYLFWQSFGRVADIAGKATLAFGLTVGTIALAVFAYRRLRTPEGRRSAAAWIDRQAERPWLQPLARPLRPVVRRVLVPAARATAPPFRFAIGRLTPGGLGIEFTTAVAVAGAGLFGFALLATTVADSGRMVTGDRIGLDIADDLRGETAVDVAKLVTGLGTLPAVGGLVLVAALVLAWRRRPAELLVLVSGLALVFAGVHSAKAGIDRPRPEGPLVPVDGSSYPSGHAAYSTVYVAVAVAAGRVLPNLASRAALVLACIGLGAAVGLTRVYLRVHFWSDVVGGWALGLGVFAACGAIALVVSHMRQNQSSRG